MDVTGGILCRSLGTNHVQHFGLKEAATYLRRNLLAHEAGGATKCPPRSESNLRPLELPHLAVHQADLDNFTSRAKTLSEELIPRNSPEPIGSR